jgi:hypothetical protein
MKQVHQYSVDRATQTARLGAVSPVRKYVRGQADDHPPIQVQLAGGELHFYDQGGQPISIDEVPEDVLEDLKRNPLRKGSESVEQVLRFCEFCPRTAEGDLQPIASNEYEAHLKQHILASASAQQRVAEDPEGHSTSPTAVAQGRAKRRAKGGAKAGS